MICLLISQLVVIVIGIILSGVHKKNTKYNKVEPNLNPNLEVQNLKQSE